MGAESAWNPLLWFSFWFSSALCSCVTPVGGHQGLGWSLLQLHVPLIRLWLSTELQLFVRWDSEPVWGSDVQVRTRLPWAAGLCSVSVLGQCSSISCALIPANTQGQQREYRDSLLDGLLNEVSSWFRLVIVIDKERRVIFLSYLESWIGTKQSLLENADFLPFVKINSSN